MPIKFRCPNCRQFLGISRAKAGALTDCPNCGRTIRVPRLDGRVEPIPQPTLDLKDNGLAQALDALAAIGENKPVETLTTTRRAESSVQAPPRRSVVAKTGGESVAATLAPPRVRETVTAPKPLPAPSPVVIDPLPAPSAKLLPPPEAPSALPVAPVVKPATNGATSKASASHADPLADLLELADSKSQLAPVRPKPSFKHWLLPLAFVGVFLGGIGLGRWTVTGSSMTTVLKPSDDDKNATIPNENRSGSKAAEPAVASSDQTGRPSTAAVGVMGRITYVGPAGDSRADVGARVLAFPQEKRGASKLLEVGFHVGAKPVDFNIACNNLRTLQGDFALANAEGKYELRLPAAGQYQILVISRNQAQLGDRPKDASLDQVLEDYFDQPKKLIGPVKMEWKSVRFNGETAVPRDVNFDK